MHLYVARHNHFFISRLTRPQKHSRTFTYSNASQNSSERSDEIKRSFNWTQERMKLLGKLINALLGSIQQWEAFRSPNGGDIDYFSDLRHPNESKSSGLEDNGRVGRSLRAINKTFGNLQGLLQKLELLRTNLNNDFKTVSQSSFRQMQLCRRGCIADHLIVSLHCAFPWKATMQTRTHHLPRFFQFEYVSTSLVNTVTFADSLILGVISNHAGSYDIFYATYGYTVCSHPILVFNYDFHSYRGHACNLLVYEEVGIVAE